MGQVELRLPFTLVLCDGCGKERPAGARCPHCGSTNVFDDPSVDRRARVVERARLALDRPNGRRKPIMPVKVFEALGAWPDPFLRACARVMEGSEDEATERIASSLRPLRGIENRVAVTRRSSADPALWVTIDGVLASLRGVAEEYLAALGAADPAACQEHADSAQRSIDAAAEAASALGAVVQREADAQSGFWRGLFVGALGGWSSGGTDPDRR